MKSILLLVTTIFIFNACSNKTTVEKEIHKENNLKTHYYKEEFIYKKEQIAFFEKEYENILKLNNKKLLKEFADFYKKNSSYFINSEVKAQTLENKIAILDTLDKSNLHKELLTKALSSSKKDAINIYENLAHEDNIFAQRELANIYKHENKLKSIFWYKKLVENNDIQSIKDLAFANLHMVSPVVVQDVNRAIELYEKLDRLGEVSGLVHLGNIYEHGYFKDEVPIDKQKSLKYFEKAAEKGYTPAQKKLVKIYLCETCEGNRYNKEKAIEVLNILIQKGDKDAIQVLENINLSSTIKEEAKEEQIQIQETQESEKL